MAINLLNRRAIIGLALLVALLSGGVWGRAAWILHRLLRSWATATVAEKSGLAQKIFLIR